jgi:hypothetical protein
VEKLLETASQWDDNTYRFKNLNEEGNAMDNLRSKKHLVLALLALVLIWTGWAQAQTPEPKRKPIASADGSVQAAVEAMAFKSKDDLYDYRFAIVNKTESKANVQCLVVECVTAPAESNAPAGWTGAALDAQRWMWTAASGGVAPGQTLKGFVLRSKGLPTVVHCAIEKPADAQALAGLTVGPGEAPGADTPAVPALLEKLLEYTKICLEQGWDGDQTGTVSDGMLSILNTAKRNLAPENKSYLVQSIAMLKQNAQQFSSSPTVFLSSEAKALYLANAEFLLKRLGADAMPGMPGAMPGMPPMPPAK